MLNTFLTTGYVSADICACLRMYSCMQVSTKVIELIPKCSYVKTKLYQNYKKGTSIYPHIYQINSFT